MIEYIIPLLASFFSFDWCEFFLFPFLALAFIATVPRIILSFFRG